MTQIEITDIKRFTTYSEIFYKMRFILPTIYGTGAAPKNGLNIILSSYPEGFSSEIVVPEGTVIVFNDKESFIDEAMVGGVNLNQIKNKLVQKYNNIRTKLDGLTLKPFDNLAGLTWDGITWS